MSSQRNSEYVEIHPSTQSYQENWPERAFPEDRDEMLALVGATGEIDGLNNDGVWCDFLPGGLHGPGDERGNLVARAHSGSGPLWVLAIGITRGELKQVLFATDTRIRSMEGLMKALSAHNSATGCPCCGPS